MPGPRATGRRQPGPGRQGSPDPGIVCEEVKDGIPYSLVAFSISAGKIYCFTFFDSIAEDMPIYHHWIFRDRPAPGSG